MHDFPVLSKADLKALGKDTDGRCAPVSIAALTGQPYRKVLKLCKAYGWTPETGLNLIDICIIIEELGLTVEVIQGSDDPCVTLAQAKRQVLQHNKRYLLGAREHVLAWVEGAVVDTYHCAGNTKINEIIEIYG